MKALASLGLALAAYQAITTLQFGSVLAPLSFVMFWSDRLEAPHWRNLAILGIGTASSVFFYPLKNKICQVFRLPAFVAASLIFSVLIVGIYADFMRRKAVYEFSAEQIIQNSFFQSIREAPREYQYFFKRRH